MAVLLVTYDLNKPGQDYSDFHKTIKKNSWAKLSESSYAIETIDAPQAVYSALKPYMDKNDNVYVINLRSPYFGQGPQDVNDWLSKHLG